MRDRFDTIVFHDRIRVHINPTHNIIYYHYRNPNSLNAVKHFGYGFCRDLTPASASAWRLRLRLLTHLFFYYSCCVCFGFVCVRPVATYIVAWRLLGALSRRAQRANDRELTAGHDFILLHKPFFWYFCLSLRFFLYVCILQGCPPLELAGEFKRSEVGCALFTYISLNNWNLCVFTQIQYSTLYTQRDTERELYFTVNDLWCIRSRENN